MWPVFKLLSSLAIVTGILWLAGVGNVGALLAGADPRWLLLAGGCLTLSTFLMALRWQWIAHAYDLELDYRHAVREYYLSLLINQTLPGGVFGDASRAVRLRHQGDLKRAALSVLVERMMGQVAMFGILTIGCAVALFSVGRIVWPTWFWTIPAGVALAGALLHMIRHSNSFLAGLAGLLRQGGHLTLSFMIALLLVFSLSACAAAIGADLPLIAVITLMPLILTAMLIPFTVGGWGWREGAAAALFPLAGATAAEGVAAGIVYGAMLLITSLPALIWVLTPTGLASFDGNGSNFRPTR